MFTLLLLILYPLAVQVERGGWWLLILPFTLVVVFIDFLANFTELSIALWEFPKKNEWTFSTRLLRLKHNTDWRGPLARFAVAYCDFFYPGHV